MIVSEVTSKRTKLSDIPLGSYFLRDGHLFFKSYSCALVKEVGDLRSPHDLDIITFIITSTSMDRHDFHPDTLVKQVEIENIEYKLIQG